MRAIEVRFTNRMSQIDVSHWMHEQTRRLRIWVDHL